MSYQPHVGRLLAGAAEVVGPGENGQYSRYTLDSLDRWIRELGRPDVVHWNNGLHDVGHNPDRTPIQFCVQAYAANVEAILQRLREWTPLLIWATTTPVHPQRPLRTTEWSWRNEEIEAYNEAALAVMKTRAVLVNDLHALVREDVDAYLSEDQLHLSTAGQNACGRAVAASVSRQLRVV